jgi:pSer/pThr/pTyr-binding forkhead associated (FHA) protein
VLARHDEKQQTDAHSFILVVQRRAGSIVGVGGTNVVYQIVDGENLLGCEGDCSVVIEGKGISRHHARITGEGGRVLVEDLGSKNGTSLNGRRLVSSEALSGGDELRIGMVRLTFRAHGDDETSTIGSSVADGEAP